MFPARIKSTHPTTANDSHRGEVIQRKSNPNRRIARVRAEESNTIDRRVVTRQE